MSPPVETLLSLPGAHPCLLLFPRLSATDQELFHLINGAWTNPLLDRAMPALSTIGDLGAVWIALLGAMAALGKKAGRRVALAGLVALVIGFAASELIKELTSRPRPFAVLPDVRLLIPEPSSFAFPSGHTTSAFAASSGAVLAARRLLGRVPPWGWGMLALAAAISYSRVYVGVHWPTDVAAGVVLGLASGWAGARLVGGPKNPVVAAARAGRAHERVLSSGDRSAFPSSRDGSARPQTFVPRTEDAERGSRLDPDRGSQAGGRNRTRNTIPENPTRDALAGRTTGEEASRGPLVSAKRAPGCSSGAASKEESTR